MQNDKGWTTCCKCRRKVLKSETFPIKQSYPDPKHSTKVIITDHDYCGCINQDQD